MVGGVFGWRCLWLESRSRVLTGEAKKGKGHLKKVATEPKISILPLFGWRGGAGCCKERGKGENFGLRCIFGKRRGRVLQGGKRDKDS